MSTAAEGTIIIAALSSAQALARAVQNDRAAGVFTKTLADSFSSQFQPAKEAVLLLETPLSTITAATELHQFARDLFSEATDAVAACATARKRKDWAKVASLMQRSEALRAIAERASARANEIMAAKKAG